MVDLSLAKRRIQIALENYLAIAPDIKVDGDWLIINKHKVDMWHLQCDCADFDRNGRFTPCKHIITGLLYQNSLNHD